MSHHIRGFIADRDKLKGAVKDFDCAYVVELLANNLGFLPYTDDLWEVMKKGFFHKHNFPVAFIETEYFGGFGEQRARVKEGREVLLAKGQINDALRLLGVVATPDKDEFDVVGLGRWRDNEDWVEFAPRA